MSTRILKNVSKETLLGEREKMDAVVEGYSSNNYE